MADANPPADADSPIASGNSSHDRSSTVEPRQSDSDVTLWLRALESGDQEAAAQLWACCYPRLLRHARQRLPERLRRVLDEEDVALSAFKSLCLGAAQGSFAEIQGRDELWRMLLCITSRKAQGYIRHETRQKRGGGKVRGESIFLMGGGDRSSDGGLHQIPDEAQSPEMLAEFTGECEKLLDALEDETLQTIALLRMEGYSVQEIAERVGCAKRSVERRLNLIRTIWQSFAP